MTARELAAHLEVSTRTIYRDVDALSAAGVPIHMERGALGGIVLADDYRRALAQFGPNELTALFSIGSGPFGDVGIPSPALALQKLAGALSEAQRLAAQTSRDRLLVDHNRWSRSEQPTEVLVRLREASEGDLRVLLDYRDRGGALSSRRVDPLGLVAKAGVWYLVAAEADKGYRTFRAERIVRVDVLAERFARPSDFRLESHWNESVTAIERQTEGTFDVVLRLALEALPKVSPFWDCAVVAADDASTTIRVAFPSRDVALVQILVLGAGAREIVSPPGLAAEIVAVAHCALAQYAADQGSSANAIVMPASANPK